MKDVILHAIELVPQGKARPFVPVSRVKPGVLSNALKKIAPGCPAENAVALLDTTLFGSG